MIKVFLSGIVNSTNAQNLNCLALARHLDKNKFEVRALTVYSGNLPVEKIDGVEYLPIRYPAKIWRPMQLIRGIMWADVSYLCKPEYWKLQRWIVRTLRKKTFGTVENVYSGVAKERALTMFGNEEEIRAFHSFRTHSFAITKAMIEKNKAAIGIPDQDGMLYLGTDYDKFAANKQVDNLTDVLLVGADLKRKGIDDYLALAKRFPQLKFHIVGGGVGGGDYAAQCKVSGLGNVIFHGQMNHSQLKKLLSKVQLHVFPSRAEGFPKVTLETAAAGVPSIVYDDYGADEWIATGRDGFVVKTLDDMAAVVKDLLDHPEKLQSLADNACALAKRFDWKVQVKCWEREIVRLANG